MLKKSISKYSKKGIPASTNLKLLRAFVQCIIIIFTMHRMNIPTLDLNLLRALKALLDERHVTRAAASIGLSQPAMSRALQRLRKMFNDLLLIKNSSGYELTSRAHQLYEPLQEIFLQLNQLVSPPSFDPAAAEVEISIAMRDYEMVTILPAIMSLFSKEAPHLKLRIIPLVGEAMTALEQHDVDFTISATETNSAMLYQKKLLTDNFACLLSAKESKQELTLEQFVAMKHCLITISGVGPGVVDKQLAEQGLHREIMVRVPNFLAASHLIKNSNLILTLPQRLAKLLSDDKTIVMIEAPLKLPDFSVYLYWHCRNHTNPMHQWIRKKISQAIQFQ